MTELAAAIRFVHIASAVLLAGSFAFLVFIARPAFAGTRTAAGPWALFSANRHRRIAAWSLAALVVSALTALWVQALVVGGAGPAAASVGTADTGLAAVVPLLTGTLYGKVWLARMTLAGVLAVLLLTGAGGHADSPARIALGLGLSACLLASIAFTGHAVAGEGALLVVQIGADVLHVVAAGAWLGALLPLTLLLRHCSRDADIAAQSIIRAVTWRFSRLGMVCVATLIVTGGLNAWALVGGVPQLVGTPYGQLLLLKLSLLLPMLGVAAINLFRINPAIASASPAARAALPLHAATLARNAMIEAGLGLMILFIVGSLGMTPPARHVQPDWPFAFRWDWDLLDAAPKARDQVDIGLALLVLGLFVLQFAFLSRTLRKWTAGVGGALVIYALTVILTPVTTDAYPTTYRRPTVAYHAISVANGKQLYAKNCTVCHGPGGHGDGPAAEGMRPRPADLSGRHANAHTAGDLFWWVSYGMRDSAMAGFSASLTEEERWDLINFVRALAGGKRARGLAPIIEDQPWLVAPDFVYATSDGETRTLKDFRGDKLVLLVLPQAQHAAARLAQLGDSAALLRAAGVEIIAVPSDPRRGNVAAQSRLPLVTEGNSEIHETYALFAGSFSEEAPGAAAAHVEYLIDRQGYIRARWLPAEGGAWRSPAAIVKQAELLLKEVPRAPAPLEHVH